MATGLKPLGDLLQNLRLRQFFCSLKRTLPQNQYPPSKLTTLFNVLKITLPITDELLPPPLWPTPFGGGRRRKLKEAAVMHVPEAAVYKDYGTVFRENQIRFSRQTFVVQPITKPQRMDPFPQPHLGAGILTPNAGHVVAALILQ